MSTIIDGYVPRNQDRFFGPKPSTIIPVQEDCTELDKLRNAFHPVTLVIHDKKSEPIFTETQVKALLLKIDSDIMDSKVQRTIFKRAYEIGIKLN